LAGGGELRQSTFGAGLMRGKHLALLRMWHSIRTHG
jgi:hypothetical protein